MQLVDFLSIAGIAALAGMVVTRKRGPFGVFELVRSIGLPFTCSACMAFWSALVAGALSALFPPLRPLIAVLGAAGFAYPLMALCGVIDLSE